MTDRIELPTPPTIKLSYTDKNGNPYEFPNVPILWYYSTFKIIQQVGEDEAFHLAQFGAAAILAQDESTHPVPPPVVNHLQNLINLIVQQSQIEHWNTPTDVVLSCCYHLMYDKKISRIQAADIANFILNPKDPKDVISVNGWRMRVDRWANDSRRKFPQIRLRKNQIGSERTK